MTLQFVGGPYDGMTRAAIDCREVMSLLDIRTRRGRRKFTMLPSPADWPGVVAGTSRLRDSTHFYYYELVSAGHSLLYLYDPEAERYMEALQDAI